MPDISGVSPGNLRLFEIAARHGNFTATARELQSTQSAVSQQIRRLEDNLGLPLFERIHRGVRLTEAGRTLYASVKEGFADIEGTINQLRRLHQRPYLSILTDFSLAAYWLVPRLPAFRARHPGLDVSIVTRQDMRNWNHHDINVAIVFCDEQQFATVPQLFREEVVPVCSPAFLDRYGPIPDFETLGRAPLLSLVTDNGQSWMDWPGYFEQQAGLHYPTSTALTFNNYTLLIQAAIAGQGIGLGWRVLIDDLLDNGTLVSLEGMQLATACGYGLIDNGAEHQTRAQKALLDWLLRYAESE